VTSPMWPRIEGSFGEDPGLVRALTGAYVEGLQGGRSGLTAGGVSTVVKHWVGYGATEDGFDGHNSYGRYSAFPGGAFQDHVDAFLDAFEFKVAGVMPTYNILKGVEVNGQPVEPVGAGFSRLLLTDLLRGNCGFDGVVISDWAISKDANQACLTGDPPQQPKDIAMSWGVEHLSPVERVAMGVNAGLDQFGGEDDPALLLAAVEQGLISLERIDQSALRVLTQTFELGLFDQPFVDPEVADRLVGSDAFREAGLAAQRQALVPLKSDQLRPDDTVIVHGMEDGALTARGMATTTDPSMATAALIRLSTPLRPCIPPSSSAAGSMRGSGLQGRPSRPGLPAQPARRGPEDRSHPPGPSGRLDQYRAPGRWPLWGIRRQRRRPAGRPDRQGQGGRPVALQPAQVDGRCPQAPLGSSR